MDKLKKKIKAVKAFLKEQSSFKISCMPDVKSKVIIDKKTNQYLLIWTGWKGAKYIYRIWYHFQIINDKIIVVENKTDVDLAEELEYLGIDRRDIIVAWVPDYLRDAA